MPHNIYNYVASFILLICLQGPPCRAVRGSTLYDIGCPDGFACVVGPVATVDGYTLTFCDYSLITDVSTITWMEWVSRKTLFNN